MSNHQLCPSPLIQVKVMAFLTGARKAGDGAAASSQATVKKARGAFQIDQEDWEAICCVALEGCSQSRFLRGAVFFSASIPIKAADGDAMKTHVDDLVEEEQAAGTQYNLDTKGKKNHGKGPPSGYLYAAALKATCTSMQTMGLANDPNFIAIKNHMDSLDAPKKLKGLLKQYRYKLSFDGQALLIDMAGVPRFQHILEHLLVIWEQHYGATILEGSPPPSKEEKHIATLVKATRTKKRRG
jgi:hypothetical protein